ncbi:serine/threonine-protein phosphatase 7 long form homolog [Mercurialis annua]|uniref:serine/threonine-protein phosphatase 7 long form homolog n=1 Tax=Mercurialis annua TaxID=3986 RepID=UPI00215FFFCD|nr:serine/threonine-protein phosphatase 7 long form homolog [Mercurialis annua]
MAAAHDHMQPGPERPALLFLQHDHISQDVWDGTGSDEGFLSRTSCTTRRSAVLPFARLDHRIRSMIEPTGFAGCFAMRHYSVDMQLITALVERWRPETHTFHLPGGECTVTLQDVAIQTGLPVDGHAVTGCIVHDWAAVAERVLGIPACRYPKKPANSTVRTSWILESFPDFSALPDQATDELVHRYTRAYLLLAVTGLCFTDLGSGKTSLRILPLLEDLAAVRTYSWGSATLAYLYHELCSCSLRSANRRNMGGALWILQLWALDRLRVIAPALADPTISPHLPLGDRWGGRRNASRAARQSLPDIRVRLDTSRYEDFIWQSYTDDMLDTLPVYCLDGRAFWRATVPLIYFHIVEWHQADRVLQQFGLQQGIPDAPLQDHSLHTITLKSSSSWMQTHSHYIRVWDDRLRFVISGQPLQDPPHYHSEYMDWFRYVTRRWITRQGAELGAQADFVERVRRDAPVDTELRRFAASTQRGTREDRRDVTSPPIEPSIPPHRLPVIPDAPIDPTTLRHRRRERRHPPAPPQRPTDPMPPPVVFHPFRGHYYYAGSSSAPPPFSSGLPSSSGQFYGDSAHHYFQGSCSYPVPPGPSSHFVPPPPAYVPPTMPPFQVQWDQPTQGTQDFPASQGLPETPGTTDFLSYGSSWLGLDSMEAMMFRQQEEFVTPPPATTSTAIPQDQQGDDGADDEDADAGEGDGDGRPGRRYLTISTGRRANRNRNNLRSNLPVTSRYDDRTPR